MDKQQLAMGIAIAGVSLIGLWKTPWFIENTAKGRLLVHWFGKERATRVMQAFLLGCATLGVLLALDIVRPMRW
ncbi:MAG: hypothetical protein AB7O26_06205 [Planctomycetaceae bacterium]